MIQAISNHSYPIYTSSIEGNVKLSPTLQQIKKTLSGRVFEHGKGNLLIPIVTYHVIRAVISFFSGYWVACAIHLIVSSFMATLVKEIDEFTNLHKATETHRRENERLAANNRDLGKKVHNLHVEVENLQKENGQFRVSNQTYTQQNILHKELLDTLGQTTENLKTELQTAISSQARITKRTMENLLVNLLQTIDRIKDERKLLQGCTSELDKEQREWLEQIKEIFKQVRDAGNHQIQIVTELNEEVSQGRETLFQLRAEIASLQSIHQHLQQDEARIRKAIAHLEETVQQNSTSAHVFWERTSSLPSN